MMRDMFRASLRADGWTTSSHTGTAQACCVMVKLVHGHVVVRDSKNRNCPDLDSSSEPFLAVPAADWDQLLRQLSDGVRAPGCPDACVVLDGDGGASLVGLDGVELVYSNDEWTAFLAGVCDGELTSARLRPPHKRLRLA